MQQSLVDLQVRGMVWARARGVAGVSLGRANPGNVNQRPPLFCPVFAPHQVLCPLVDAVHYRNSFALHELLSAALPGVALPPADVFGLADADLGMPAPANAARPLASVAAVQACLLEQDYYGQTLLHAAVHSKSAGCGRAWDGVSLFFPLPHACTGWRPDTFGL